MIHCAVVDSSNTVIGLVFVESENLAPENCKYIAYPDSAWNCPKVGFKWDGNVFIGPDPINMSDYSYDS